MKVTAGYNLTWHYLLGKERRKEGRERGRGGEEERKEGKKWKKENQIN